MPRTKNVAPMRIGAVDYLADLGAEHVLLRRTCCGKFEKHSRHQLWRSAKAKTELCWHCYLVSRNCADRPRAFRPRDLKLDPQALIGNGDTELWSWLLACPVPQGLREAIC